MKSGRTIAIVAVGGLIALWFAYGRIVVPILGDGVFEAEAVEAAEMREGEAEAARVERENSFLLLAEREQEIVQIKKLAESLPEINVGRPDGALNRWYVRNLTTPTEFRASSFGSTVETLPDVAPTNYWTNNDTCRPTSEDGSAASQLAELSFAACQEQLEPTVIIGTADVTIALGDFKGDCRAAAGWLFSRFFESGIDSEGNPAPTSNLKAWILPGSLTAVLPWCGNDLVRETIADAIGIDFGQYPEDAEDSEEPDNFGGGDDDANDEEMLPAVSVRFTLLFRPIAPTLCVPNLVGYEIEYDEEGQEVPYPFTEAEAELVAGIGGVPQEWIDCPPQRTIFLEEQTSPPNRECFPRLPFATLIEGGDQLAASLMNVSAATGEWIASLDDCDMPLEAAASVFTIDGDDSLFGDFNGNFNNDIFASTEGDETSNFIEGSQ